MKILKTLLIATAIVLIIAILVGIAYYVIPLLVHKEIIDNSKMFKPYSVTSEDGHYILLTEKIERITGTYATFNIISVDDNEIVYKCPNDYRTMDLKSIDWDKLDVVVESSDVGKILYEYKDGKWTDKD